MKTKKIGVNSSIELDTIIVFKLAAKLLLPLGEWRGRISVCGLQFVNISNPWVFGGG